MLQTQPQPPADLVTEASRYRGLHYRYLIALLRDPDQTDADVARSIGLVSDTPASWWPDHPDLRDLRDRIRSSQSMRQEYARAAMLAAVPDAVDALIAVATDPKARDGQRARERILEETGVLQRQGQPADDGGTARATLALLVGALREAQGRQRQPEAQRTIIDVAPRGDESQRI